jgi:rhodanese-related sulfurtransferase
MSGLLGKLFRAAALLTREGHTVVSLSGGMRACVHAGLPVIAPGGQPGQVI